MIRLIILFSYVYFPGFNRSERNKDWNLRRDSLFLSPRSTRCSCVTPVLWKRPLTWRGAWCQNTLRKPSSSVPCTPSPSSPFSSVSPRYSRYCADVSVTSTTSDTCTRVHVRLLIYIYIYNICTRRCFYRVYCCLTFLEQDADVGPSGVAPWNVRTCDSVTAVRSVTFSLCFVSHISGSVLAVSTEQTDFWFSISTRWLKQPR